MRRQSTTDRFWQYVAKGDGCWLWTAGFGRRGYGKFWVNGHTVGAHRFSYEIAVGPIPDGLFVCHSCDNPPCVNPAHLWLGDALANQRDCKAKGRTATGERGPNWNIRGDGHWSRQHPERLRRGDNHPARLHPEHLARGEQSGSTHLTDDDVRAIRSRHKRRIVTEQMLADEYGVSVITINRIRRRVTWTHIA